MVELGSFLGLVYAIGKDVLSMNEYKEVEDKPVDIGIYLKDSGVEDRIKEKGYTYTWANKKNVTNLELKGWEILYVLDKKKKEKYSLVGNDTRLMCKKEESDKEKE